MVISDVSRAQSYITIIKGEAKSIIYNQFKVNSWSSCIVNLDVTWDKKLKPQQAVYQLFFVNIKSEHTGIWAIFVDFDREVIRFHWVFVVDAREH